ncbi:hypothetical protein B0H34DRAFT_803116 [Crassisporium funariophilum]|nr:hypothetical protein B0H34DRAFT_803116 [Crassisporium funariophilum]
MDNTSRKQRRTVDPPLQTMTVMTLPSIAHLYLPPLSSPPPSCNDDPATPTASPFHTFPQFTWHCARMKNTGTTYHSARSSRMSIPLLSTILKPAPAVTTLVLAKNFLEMAHPALGPLDHDAEQHEEPIWKHAAAHLVEPPLEAPGCTERMDPSTWHMLFTKGRWLDLLNMACDTT